MKKAFISASLLFLFVSAFLGISAVTTGQFDETSLRILITTSAASFYSLIGLTCVANLGKRVDWFGKLGLAFCAIALIHAIYTTWTTLTSGWDTFTNRFTFLIVAIAIAHASLMLLIGPRNGVVTALIALAIGSVALNTAIVIMGVLSADLSSIRTITSLAIVGTCATIAAPALNLAVQGSVTSDS